MTETKAERFIRVVNDRVNKALDALGKVGKCADRRMYDYTPEQVEKILSALSNKCEELRKLFETPGGRKRFSLSNAGWYWISGDNGSTWTKQILTTEEAERHLSEGYLLKKTAPLEGPPRLRLVIACDVGNADFTLYASAPNIDCQIIDTSSNANSDDHLRIQNLETAISKNEMFIIL